MQRSAAVGLVLVLTVTVGATACLAVVSGGVAATADGDVHSSSDAGAGAGPVGTMSAVQSNPASDFDTTQFEITVYEDGAATWTFRYERHLETPEEVETFRTFAEQFEDEETDLYGRFTDQARALTATGAEQTDREMTAEDFERSAAVNQRLNTFGVVEMSFTWTNFARVDAETGTVTVGGDVFDGSLYIGGDQTLTIVAGDDLSFNRVVPTGEFERETLSNSGWVSWAGEREFLDGRPRVALEPAETPANGSAVAGDDGPPLPQNGPGSLLSLLGVVALVVACAVALAWYRGPLGDLVGKPSGSDTAAGDAGGPDVPDDGTAGEEPTADETDDAPATDSDPILDEELLTDEDRVVSLIDENGGRMKQVNIVEETGWSKSKVSMLLSDMEDAGTISKLRVGRENIVSLEGFEPEATKSPFEERRGA